ncbi:hypothetical protein HPB49_009698 [Dermacentor silvarum]|uniref:Uncharacterized protein n=1 Tax=Dermacentor silvarum TaxID=543639 RepID=A0ACB8CEE1_DERSI|nr:hypothetical protein HPB49_009698 [Dermacentor silvarum]
MPGGPTKFRSVNRYEWKRTRSKKIPKAIPSQSAQDAWQLAAEIVLPPNINASTALPDHASPEAGSTLVRIDTPVVTEQEVNEIRVCEQATLDKIASMPTTERKIRRFEDPTANSATASVAEPAAPYIIVELAAVNNLIGVLSWNTCGGSAKLVQSDQDYGLATKLTVVCEICGEVASGWSSPRIVGLKTCNPFEPPDKGGIRSIKCPYRKTLIQRLLLNFQLKRPTNVDMFMALEMVAAAWVVSCPAVTANCFKHVGFTATQQASCTDLAPPEEDLPKGTLDDSADGAVPPSLTNTWGELCAVATGVPDGLSVNEFVRVDGNVVHEEMTDEAIISNVCEADYADGRQKPSQEKTTNPRDVFVSL